MQRTTRAQILDPPLIGTLPVPLPPQAEVLVYYAPPARAVSGQGDHSLPAVIRVPQYIARVEELCSKVACTRRNVLVRDNFQCHQPAGRRRMVLRVRETPPRSMLLLRNENGPQKTGPPNVLGPSLPLDALRRHGAPGRVTSQRELRSGADADARLPHRRRSLCAGWDPRVTCTVAAHPTAQPAPHLACPSHTAAAPPASGRGRVGHSVTAAADVCGGGRTAEGALAQAEDRSVPWLYFIQPYREKLEEQRRQAESAGESYE
ncbi:MAG: hypothetical protein WDW36_009961 [Sanguina aurantia]